MNSAKLPVNIFKNPLLLNTNRYKLYYSNIICQDLILKQNYNTIFEIPSFKKIILNTTSKHYMNNKKSIISALLGLELITGRKPKLTYAKNSIASFKLRNNQLLGCKVTLRGAALYNFLDLIITIILPRLRDFSKISINSFKKPINYSLGFRNLLIFPELEDHFELFELFKGFNINFIMSSSNISDCSLLSSAFQLPCTLSNAKKKKEL